MYNLNISSAALHFADGFTSKDNAYSGELTSLYAIRRAEGAIIVGCNGHSIGVFYDKNATLDTQFAAIPPRKKDGAAYRPTKKSLADREDVEYSNDKRPSLYDTYIDLVKLYTDRTKHAEGAVDTSEKVLAPFNFKGVDGGGSLFISGKRGRTGLADSTIYLVTKKIDAPFYFFGFFMPYSHEEFFASLPEWA